MKYTTLGDTDIKVSKICLGTMTWGEQNTEVEAHEQMDYALDHGVQFWDTAELYAVPSKAENQGLTEKYIGTWFHKTGRRQEVVLATKIAGPSANLAYIRNPLNFSKSSILEALEGSLQRLQTDYVDLYQIHWPERKTNFFGQRGYRHSSRDQWEDNMHEILETMNDLIKQGKIRHFGISNETPWGFQNYIKLAEIYNLPKAKSVQNAYSLLNRLYEVGMAEISIREDIGLLAYSPMAFGLLSGKYHKDPKRAQGRLKIYRDHMIRYNSEQCHRATQKYLDLAESWGISLAQIALSFVNSRPFVTSNIIGATTMDQLRENIDSIHVELTKEQIQKINEVQELIPNPAP
ncbi:MAG: aldo/keto reductase [Bacteroidia bacterium]|nr:aldo/keto reductase [Bacteroidia bacterium]